MKLLLDQNLPPRLCSLLADLFAGSIHVRDIAMSEASDEAIWEYARNHDYIIVSKDSDFQARSLLYGSPPKSIWLRVGNCDVKTIERLLRRHSATICTFAQDPVSSHLMIP